MLEPFRCWCIGMNKLVRIWRMNSLWLCCQVWPTKLVPHTLSVKDVVSRRRSILALNQMFYWHRQTVSPVLVDHRRMTATDAALLGMLHSHVKHGLWLFISPSVAQHVKHGRPDMTLGFGVPSLRIHTYARTHHFLQILRVWTLHVLRKRKIFCCTAMCCTIHKWSSHWTPWTAICPLRTRVHQSRTNRPLHFIRKGQILDYKETDRSKPRCY